jgi:hypothetical protein
MELRASRRSRMKCARFRALCMILVFAAPLFVCACSSSSDSGDDGEQDTTPPTVVASFPDSGAVSVSRTGPFWVLFSEAMDEDMFPDALAIAPGPIDINASWSGDTLVITPTVLLSAATSYTITVSGDCEDKRGNAMGNDCVIQFTTNSTVDNTPPEIVSTDPENGDTNVTGSQVIYVTFSEPMNTGTTQDAIEAVPEPEDGWAEWSGLTMELHHTAFPQDSLITITIGTGATDLSGNHLATAYTFSFRTMSDNTRPYLASASPTNGATSVPTSLSSIVFNFSEAMDEGSFEMTSEDVDARVNKFAKDNVTFSEGYATLTVPVTGDLAAGCTYWVNFRNVTDASGNPIDPNPTPYDFTTAGTATSFPVANDKIWYYAAGDGEATMSFRSYNQSTGTFNEVFQDSKGDTQEVVHLKKTSTQIQHLGRDEYHDGNFNLSMIWDAPIAYIKLPVENYLGQSWTFSTTATINDSTTMDISGHMEVESSLVDLVCDALHGTFKDCAIHHLIGSYTIYLRGNPVDEGDVHQIMWLAPGVGPVQIVNADGGSSDTLRVVDWNF